MPVIIRMNRVGRNNVDQYRIVVMDSRNRRQGEPLATLGSYQPAHKPALFNLKEEGFYQWLKKGAQVSETVRSLLKQQGIWAKWLKAAAGEDISNVPAQPKPLKIKKPQPSKKALAKQKAAAEPPPAAEKKTPPDAEKKTPPDTEKKAPPAAEKKAPPDVKAS